MVKKIFWEGKLIDEGDKYKMSKLPSLDFDS